MDCDEPKRSLDIKLFTLDEAAELLTLNNDRITIFIEAKLSSSKAVKERVISRFTRIFPDLQVRFHINFD